MCLQAKTLPRLICLQFPGMSEEAIRSPLYPQQFFRMATSFTLLLLVGYGGAGDQEPTPSPKPTEWDSRSQETECSKTTPR